MLLEVDEGEVFQERTNLTVSAVCTICSFFYMQVFSYVQNMSSRSECQRIISCLLQKHYHFLGIIDHQHPSTSCALQIEFPVAIVDKNIDRKKPETRAAAEAFVQFLFTPTAQKEFMDCGFRCDPSSL